MHYLVYETTCLIDNTKYRGVHATNNLDDGYLGSGIILVRKVKKYGKENFKRKTLEEFCNNDSAFFAERNYVDENWVQRNDTMNLMVGGLGSQKGKNSPMYGRKHSTDAIEKISAAARRRTLSKESKLKIGKNSKKCLTGRSRTETNKWIDIPEHTLILAEQLRANGKTYKQIGKILEYGHMTIFNRLRERRK